MTDSGFVPGMRDKGECPDHPGNPFYHCPVCAKERQQRVGGRIADEVQASRGTSGDAGLIDDPYPVHLTERAREHLIAFCRRLRRERIEGMIAKLRERSERLPSPNPEGDSARAVLAKLERKAEDAGIVADEFDVLPIIFIDVTGVSGVDPKMTLCEPAGVPTFADDYRVYEYPGGLRLGVELRNMNYLRGLVVDWRDGLSRSGFSISHRKGDWKYADR